MLLHLLAIIFGILTGYFIVAKVDKPPLIVKDYKVIPTSQLAKQPSTTESKYSKKFKVASQVNSIKPYKINNNAWAENEPIND
ncbi:hypothetical protein [Spartinivicinus ruber]|uniref:hypothetical protein n=1 Tax=Spartinivicinus ruber TaxID=2683272 RepID=UPI0013D0F78D|nr:hypothetical protein [Spartinivicinus ruber]